MGHRWRRSGQMENAAERVIAGKTDGLKEDGNRSRNSDGGGDAHFRSVLKREHDRSLRGDAGAHDIQVSVSGVGSPQSVQIFEGQRF